MPEIKASEVFTPLQIEVLKAVTDAIVPTLSPEEAAKIVASLPSSASQLQRDRVVEFARSGFSDHPHLLDKWARQAKASLSAGSMGPLLMLMSALGTRPGCLAITGHIGPFQNLSRATRESILVGWASSPFYLIRKAATGFKGVTLICFYRHWQTAWEAVGYVDGPADDWLNHREEGEEQITHYQYEFENDKLSAQTGDNITIDTEVLVIGSGSGGGVAAAYLAQKGAKVLCVDKGIYLAPRDMNGREDEGYTNLYDGEGLMPTEDASINILAGSTFGGGTTINWSASLKPRHFLRRAWADKFGLPYFTSPLFTNDLNAVCGRMGVSALPVKHNVSNSLLALGAARAGQPVAAVPQNSGGHTHYCGKCQLGCVSGHKQGGTVTWLRDAAEAGAKFMTSTHIDRILFEGRQAVGALATVDGRKVTIRASKGIVVAAGSMQTPPILLRTPELKYNKQIGQHLHLHPATMVTGYYNFPVKPWEGGLLTTVSDGAEMVDAEGWGCKIEVIASSPSIHAGFSSYQSAMQHKAKMLQYAHSWSAVVIARDRDAGRVVLDSEGVGRSEYLISQHDQRSLLQGILHACDIHMTAGAIEISTGQVGLPPFRPKVHANGSPVLPETNVIAKLTIAADASPPNDISDPDYIAWRKQSAKIGVAPLWCSVGSAHQMGSCRMGSNPKTSALDPEGRVWGAKGLWVADASVLPESSGVNPMITTMATARGIARNVATELGYERNGLQTPEAAGFLRESRI